MKGREVAVIKANEGGKEEGGLAIHIAVAAREAGREQGNQVVLGKHLMECNIKRWVWVCWKTCVLQPLSLL